MITFKEFCIHYDLDADNPDSQEEYREYKEAMELLMRIVGGDERQGEQMA